MKIAIIGYGKMGRMIESIALERGHTIGSRIDVDNQELMSGENLKRHDVAIELTGPESAYNNISRCLDAGLPIVSGTTGWTGKLDELKERCISENGSFLYASNFSLGVNLLFYMNRHMASIMDRYRQYNVRINEVHHIRKLDAPSGTALSLAEDILEVIERKNEWTLQHSDKPGTGSAKENEKLVIESIREGDVPGIHEIIYESESDSLSLRHSAKDRRGFATGAVMAAEFIHNKKGFYTMKEVLSL